MNVVNGKLLFLKRVKKAKAREPLYYSIFNIFNQKH